MKKTLLTIVLLLAAATNLMSAQKPDMQGQAEEIANAITTPLYNYDIDSVTSIVKTIAGDNDIIRAIDLIDSNSNDVVFAAYKTDDNTYTQAEPPENFTNDLYVATASVVYEQEKIGDLRLYYLPFLATVAVDLTDEERNWITEHPEIRVANETDSPPFDFSEGGKPQGFSIDLIRMIAERTGLNISFVSGFTWSELLEKFKNREIDVIPAIFKSTERSKWMVFTTPYADNPTVLVLQKNNTTVNDLDQLSGKKIAVIPGYSTVEELKSKYPDIIQVEVEDIAAALVAVSTGKVDAFVESIAPVSYLLQHQYISNIRIADEVLKDLKENKKLHIAVLKDNQTLLTILQKGLDSISANEKEELYGRWIKTQLGETEKNYQELVASTAIEYFLYLPPILLFIFLVVYLYLFKRLRLSKLLTFTFVIITSVAITVIALISFQTARKSLEEESFNKLTAVREIKSQQLNDYFSHISGQALTFSENQMTIQAMKELSQAFNNIDKELQRSPEAKKKNNRNLANYYQNEFLHRLNPNLDNQFKVGDFIPKSQKALAVQHLYLSGNSYRTGHKHNLDHAGDNSSYSDSHRKFHPIIRNYLHQFGYYDIFLVEPENGHIVYSVFKEVDYGTSLLDGPYKDSNIARVFREANAPANPDVTVIVDFEPYYPSYYAPAAFIASPIFDGQKKIGVLIFQMPVEKINQIMTNSLSWAEVGLGLSGETYVVGPDFKLRNQSRFFIEDRENYIRMITDIDMPADLIEKIINLNTTIGLQPVSTIGTKDAMAGNTDTRIFADYRGVEVLSSYKPLQLEGLQWVIMSEIDKDEAFSYVYFLRNVMFVCYIIIIFIIIIIVYYFSSHITKPLNSLTEYAGELAGHDFTKMRSSAMTEEVNSISASANEVGILAKTFLHMEKELGVSVQNLMQTTAIKERMQSELNIGKEIQMHMLPTRFPEQTEIDVYGTLLAAKEVGGDWYDIFFIDEDHFCFGIGDVSGKGVPAALFMAVAKTLIKATALLERSTANVITHLNKELSVDNPNFMFATIFLCVLNIKTGELLFTNAAHNPAYVRSRDGEIRTVDSRHGLVVGPLPDSTYEEETITLSSGDTFFLYTDGVTEAMDPAENLFTDERLIAHLASPGNDLPLEIVQSTVKVVKEFEAGGEQADDITILAVTFNGSQQKTSNIFEHTINGQLTKISALNKNFEKFSRQQEIAEADVPKLHIVFEELLSNIINYGPAEQKDLSITVTVEHLQDKLEVTIIDNGIPFNPLDEIASPDTTLPLEERTIGGLGFHIVQNIVDDIHYERKEDKNILTFSKKINQS